MTRWFKPEGNAVLMLCRNATSKTTIDSVLAQDVPVSLLCIDNDSTPEIQKLLSKYWPEVNHARFVPQLGVSAGWNYGLQYFFDHGAEFVWVLNDDVICRSDNLRELRDDGGLFVTAVGENSPEKIKGEFTKARRWHPDFSNFLIRRECWERIGTFDTEMELYAQDADYHLRMHLAGIEAYTMGVPFFHVVSGTIKSLAPAEAQAIHNRADQDRAVFRRKWHNIEIGSAEYYALFTVEKRPDEPRPDPTV